MTASVPAESSPTSPSTPVHGVIPYISMRGRAGEAADFYVRAFAATNVQRYPLPGAPGRFMHVELTINGGALMLTDGMGDDDTGAPGLHNAHLQLMVAGAADWWQRAVDAGCAVVCPFEHQPWGDEWGLLVDPFGVHWGITTI